MLNLTQARTYSVIFADDDNDMLAMLSAIGKSRGWQVDTATTAEALLEKVQARCAGSRNCYDIVVMDVSFFSDSRPGISGITAGRQLERAFPNLPILFVTAYDGLLTRENVRAIKTADYLEKPFDPDELIRRIEYLIRFTSRYEGPDRRRTSINRTDHCRRATDSSLGVPTILKALMRTIA